MVVVRRMFHSPLSSETWILKWLQDHHKAHSTNSIDFNDDLDLNNRGAQGGKLPEEEADPKLLQEVFVVLPRGHHVPACKGKE